MGVLINGMDMPKDGDYLFSFASDENGRNPIVRIENCKTKELIRYGEVFEVPTHGKMMFIPCDEDGEPLQTTFAMGEWLEWSDDTNTFECSRCGIAMTLHADTPQANGYNYCPNCGADMRGRIY